MKTLFTYLLPFIGKHWMRIGIVGVLIFLLNQKQIDLSIQLGKPAVVPVQTTPGQPVKEMRKKEEVPVFTDAGTEQKSGWLDRLNIFGGSDGSSALHYRLKSVSEEHVKAFIRRFKSVAKTEQEKYGIPVSIILANALLHSQAGTGEATLNGNNLFGLDCSSDWAGATIKVNNTCLRSYQNAWTSFRDHSLYLTTGRYATLPRLGNSNYRDWARALGELSYADAPDLEQQLLATIDEWQLFQYD